MNKKISSIIVIFMTILYVTITLYLNGFNIVEMGSIKARQVLNSIKSINIGTNIKLGKDLEVKYENVKQASEIEAKKSSETANKIYKLNSLKLTKETKKVKRDSIHQAERELLKSIFDKTPIEENYTSNETINNDEVSVFNTEVKYELTDSDKERILSAAKKLSPIDYEKINTYMKYANDSNAKDAINLLRDRLSDKDFEKIKDISVRFNKKKS